MTEVGPFTPFLEGGWSVWLVLLLTMVGLTAGVASASLSGMSNRAAVLALGAVPLVFGLMVVGVGVAGWLSGRAEVDEVLLHAESDSAEMIRTVGYREASWSLWCGLLGAAPALLLGAGTVARVASRRVSGQADDGRRS